MNRIIERMKSAKPIKWLFAGDSITHGALHTWGARDYTELFSERIRYEMDRRRDFVIKAGISGWSTSNVREDIEWNILQFRPDVVSIMIGMNDCVAGADGLTRFRDDYGYILDRIADNPESLVFLNTPNPTWAEATERASLPLYADVVRQIARERQLPLIDHWNHWTQAWQQNPGRRCYWMNDPIHPGTEGHRAFAHLIMKELNIFDPASNVCRLFVP